ncbi:cyclase [Labedella phragmitis]|uniref:Cyclase n=1 Tax=Labedella phragmitis TaxID=2498849 RepID=A0A444PQW6_9MICO|nr:SRPBCC family protein [Labedella phragmitis]RWZ49657.1 cyclase [Labedella phragmitis]
MTVHLRLETVVPLTPGQAFDLSRDVGLHLDSLVATRETVVAGRRSGLLQQGEHVAWRGRHLGVPFTLMSRLTTVDYPRLFVDEEIAGPFRRLRHEHRFEPHRDGTLVTDDITFAAPLGPLGRLVEKVVLEKYMRGLISARNAHLLVVARGIAVRAAPVGVGD